MFFVFDFQSSDFGVWGSEFTLTDWIFGGVLSVMSVLDLTFPSSEFVVFDYLPPTSTFLHLRVSYERIK